jgi:hypothetical protein
VVDKRSALAWLGAATVFTALGVMLTATAPHVPGSEPLSLEDAVDAIGILGVGGLGVALVRRGVAAGLGRALVLTAMLSGIIWLSSGLADTIAAGTAPSLPARLLYLVGSVLFIPVYLLLIEAPLLLFPTGRLLSPGWRWVAGAAITGACTAMASMLITPGYLDDDVHAWGRNPLGVDALDGVLSAFQIAGLILLLGSLLASVAAAVVRLVRYRGARRRQMWWFLAGAGPLIVGELTDPGSSAAAQVASAAVIFTGLIGGMAWALLGPPGRATAGQDRSEHHPAVPVTQVD